MARRLRIQYEGAIYHVINRGNYRRDVFETVGAAQAFEAALIEACENYGWRLHAHVVMRNHYHLAVETPRANLVEGMHWLQSTYATRFNRLRRERGHLFQGRYQALLIEDTAALARVVDYIHLNPVRARVVPVDQLASFRWSSLRRFVKGPRPGAFSCEGWLELKGWKDSKSGWHSYLEYLSVLAADEEEQKRLDLRDLSKGWSIGTKGWRQAIARDYADQALAPGLEAAELVTLKTLFWSQVMDEELSKLDKTRADVAAEICGAPWKIALAGKLRSKGAPYRWIASELNMGKPSSIRAYLSQAKTSI